MLTLAALVHGLTCDTVKTAYRDNECCDSVADLPIDASSLQLLDPLAPALQATRLSPVPVGWKDFKGVFSPPAVASDGKYILLGNDVAKNRYNRLPFNDKAGFFVVDTETGKHTEVLYSVSFLNTIQDNGMKIGEWTVWTYSIPIVHGYVYGLAVKDGTIIRQKSVIWRIKFSDVLHAAQHSERITPEVIYTYDVIQDKLQGQVPEVTRFQRNHLFGPFGYPQSLVGDYIYYHEPQYLMNSMSTDIYPCDHVMEAVIVDGGSGVTNGTYTFPNARGGQALELEIRDEDIVDGVFTTLRQKTANFPTYVVNPFTGVSNPEPWGAYKNSGSKFHEGDIVTAAGGSGIRLRISATDPCDGMSYARLGVNPSKADFGQVEHLPGIPRGTPLHVGGSAFNGGLIYWGWQGWDIGGGPFTSEMAKLVYMPDPTNPSHTIIYDLNSDKRIDSIMQVSEHLVLLDCSSLFNVTAQTFVDDNVLSDFMTHRKAFETLFSASTKSICTPTTTSSLSPIRFVYEDGHYYESQVTVSDSSRRLQTDGR